MPDLHRGQGTVGRVSSHQGWGIHREILRTCWRRSSPCRSGVMWGYPPIFLVLSPKKMKNSKWDKLFHNDSLDENFLSETMWWFIIPLEELAGTLGGTWGRDGLGSSRSKMWPVPGTCCSRTGNVPVQCCGSTGEFECARGIQAIRLLHTLCSTWLSTRLMDSGSTSDSSRQMSWHCHMTWAQLSEDSVVVVDCTNWPIFHLGWTLQTLALLNVHLAHPPQLVFPWIWLCPTLCEPSSWRPLSSWHSSFI